ncbi:MAG: efflux transporter outer membrane subunit [Zoogloeaceae bacterium]|nr:efflux transporter outer membrane subunit [Zoogloeaceae bacterium]
MMPRTLRPLTALAAALLLAGCMVGPDYQRPTLGLPGSYAEPAPIAGQTPPAVARAWWKAFQDPMLDDLVEAALAHNADLAAAAARLEEAQGVLREVDGVEWPEFDLTGSGSRSRASTVTATSQASAPTFRNDFVGRIGTNFELDFWGKLRRASEAARADALASRYGQDTVALTLVRQVVEAYLDLRALDAQVAVTQETFASREESQRIVSRRQTGGLASGLDLRQAEAATEAVRAQLAELRRQREVTEHLLGRLSGRLDLAIPAGDLRQMPNLAAVPPGLPARLLEDRPDVRQAEAALTGANARIGVAKAALFPSISLTGSVGTQSKDLSDWFSGPASIWNIGLALDLPIFDAGQRAARVDQATARQKAALAGYIGAVRGAFTEVRDALSGVARQGEQESAQGRQVEAASQAEALARRRYAEGYSAYLEVLDAQRTAQAATLSYIASRRARLVATVDLYAALGGGWLTTETTGTP